MGHTQEPHNSQNDIKSFLVRGTRRIIKSRTSPGATQLTIEKSCAPAVDSSCVPSRSVPLRFAPNNERYVGFRQTSSCDFKTLTRNSESAEEQRESLSTQYIQLNADKQAKRNSQCSSPWVILWLTSAMQHAASYWALQGSRTLSGLSYCSGGYFSKCLQNSKHNMCLFFEFSFLHSIWICNIEFSNSWLWWQLISWHFLNASSLVQV